VGNYQPTKAIGEVRYVDDTELNAEIADFRTALEAKPNGFVEPFMTAVAYPSYLTLQDATSSLSPQFASRIKDGWRHARPTRRRSPTAFFGKI
jgi:hypothetical protein